MNKYLEGWGSGSIHIHEQLSRGLRWWPFHYYGRLSLCQGRNEKLIGYLLQYGLDNRNFCVRPWRQSCRLATSHSINSAIPKTCPIRQEVDVFSPICPRLSGSQAYIHGQIQHGTRLAFLDSNKTRHSQYLYCLIWWMHSMHLVILVMTEYSLHKLQIDAPQLFNHSNRSVQNFWRALKCESAK